jgi:hypothetical protein
MAALDDWAGTITDDSLAERLDMISQQVGRFTPEERAALLREAARRLRNRDEA